MIINNNGTNVDGKFKYLDESNTGWESPNLMFVLSYCGRPICREKQHFLISEWMILRRDYMEQYHNWIHNDKYKESKNQKKKIMNEMFLHLRCKN